MATIIYTSVDVALPEQRRLLWMGFAYAVPLSLIVLLVFNSIWGNRRFNFAIISLLIWTVLICVYLSSLMFFSYGLWQVFIIGIPGQVIVFLWSGLRYK